MSINLQCEEMDLYQTPTWVTDLCYFADTEKGTPSSWRTIREKYKLWVRSLGPNPWDSDNEEDVSQWEAINAHLAELYNYSELNFFIM